MMLAAKAMAVLLLLRALATTVPPEGVRTMPVGALGAVAFRIKLVVPVLLVLVAEVLVVLILEQALPGLPILAVAVAVVVRGQA